MIDDCDYLEWPRPVRLLPAQVELTQDGEAHEEPVAEAVVVDQLEDVLHTQVHQCHRTLEASNMASDTVISTLTHTLTHSHTHTLTHSTCVTLT